MHQIKRSREIFGLMAFFICIHATPVLAQMYKWVDDEGNISYSDQPPFKGAEQLTPPPISTTPAMKVPKKRPVKKPKEEETSTQYSYFKITDPENDATIRENNGNFSISLGIKPALNTQKGDYIQVLMDGKIVKDKLSGTSVAFTNIDRGAHQISAMIKNKKGRTLKKSQTIIIYLHRQIIQRKQPR